MRVLAYGLTDVGLKRSNNQDSILVENPIQLFAVADGMGGHKGGEVASQMALDVIKEIIQKAPATEEPRLLIKTAFSRASQDIYDRSLGSINLKGMGTTLVMAMVRDEKVFIGNVGDSRMYLFQAGHLWQLTEDHSLMNEQLRAGILAEADIDHFESKNVITRSVGFEPKVDCDVTIREVEREEAYILCSDGLHGLVSHQEMQKICTENGITEWPKLLIDRAKMHGGDDNISVVAIHVSPSKD
jgi:serine/threonine protein phosphatase PrpC